MNWNREKERRAGKAMTIGGCIYGIVFIIIWCVIALSIGAGFMLIFGLPMLGFMIFRLVVLLQKAKAEKQPKDPWEQPAAQQERTAASTNGFCPYCGGQIQEGFAFCPKCGRRQ